MLSSAPFLTLVVMRNAARGGSNALGDRVRSSRRKSVVYYLRLPGMYLVYKYTKYKRHQHDEAKKKATEKELQNLNQKIDKLLTRIDDQESGTQSPNEDEECVVCLCAKATMQTFPCGHKVVCRKCFVRTIQIAVTQRCLPLKCVVCRTKILKLRQTRDASPITPPPSRHLVRLPWQRQHSTSPSFRCMRDQAVARQEHSHTPKAMNSTKPFATRAMQSMLIYPDNKCPPKQAFGLTSALKKNDAGRSCNKSEKKQVRFASPIRNASPIRFSKAFQNDSSKHDGAMFANTCPFPTSDENALSKNANLKGDILGVMHEAMNPKVHRTILRNSANTNIPTIKQCYQNYSAPRLAGHQAGFASPLKRVTLEN